MKKISREDCYKKAYARKYNELMLSASKDTERLYETHVRLYNDISSFIDTLKIRHENCVRKANIYAVENTERIYNAQDD